MIFSTLFNEPLIFFVWVFAILIALSVHEFAHAWAGTWQGDNTAKALGRLTLNPIAHVSGLGFIMLLFVGFGWGKPVPFNPYNLRNQRYGPLLISLAGPASNLIMAIITGLILKLLIFYQVFPPTNLLIQFLNIFVILNVILMVFNLIPIPPLDGSKILPAILHGQKYQKFLVTLETQGPIVLIFLLILDSIVGINIFGHLFNGIINFVYRLLF
jgi:Zn-dependent protease